MPQINTEIKRQDMTIIGIYFDFYGTLIDQLHAQQEIWTRIGKKVGITEKPSKEQIRTGIILQSHEQTKWKSKRSENNGDNSQQETDAIHKSMLAHLGIHKDIDPSLIQDEFQQHFFEGYHLNAEVKPTLEQLQTYKVKIGLLTNAERTPTQEKLKELGIYSYFDIFIHAPDFKCLKDDPKVFQVALDSMETSDPSQVIHMGDDFQSDVKMASNIGMIPVLFDPLNFHSQSQGFLIRNFADILQIYKKLNRK